MTRERVRWAAVVDRARQIVESYDSDVTLRQVMYRLVSAGVLPHTPPMYRRLSSRLAEARREGRFPDLIDPGRAVHARAAWPDAAAFLREVPGWFRLDRTAGQRHALYVAAEKDTLRLQLTGWLAEEGVPVLVVRGFGSQSYADLVRRRTAQDDREAHLLYVGDFDCSGEDIERDWVQRTGCWSRVRRVALTREQVRERALPAVEGKRGDPRWPAFARRHGFDPARPVQWEVEALAPEELRRLVLAAVAPYVDREVLARQLADEDAQRRDLATFLGRWGETSS